MCRKAITNFLLIRMKSPDEARHRADAAVACRGRVSAPAGGRRAWPIVCA